MSRCEQCKHYGVLLTPRIIKDDMRVYGFCFKDLHENYGSAYPVYIPDGGVCKSFSKNKMEIKEQEKSIKSFIVSGEAWYKDVVSEEPHIHIGLYYENGSTDGEFTLVWDNIGIQLRVYDESWEVLSNMPELIDLMGRIQIEELKPTISEFVEMLKGIGFKDITEREKV